MIKDFTIVRLYEPDEALALAKQVSEQFIFPTFSEEGRQVFSDNLEEDIEAAFRHQEVELYGVRLGQNLVAYVAVARKSHISQLYVDSRRQRQSIGKTLLNFLEQTAKEAGVSRLTVKASLNAVPFYVKQGFETTSDIQEVSGIRFQPMQKKL